MIRPGDHVMVTFKKKSYAGIVRTVLNPEYFPDNIEVALPGIIERANGELTSRTVYDRNARDYFRWCNIKDIARPLARQWERTNGEQLG
jgi:hypothetical protein